MSAPTERGKRRRASDPVLVLCAVVWWTLILAIGGTATWVLIGFVLHVAGLR